MRITVLTLFPEMYESFLSTSIIGRALKRVKPPRLSPRI